MNYNLVAELCDVSDFLESENEKDHQMVISELIVVLGGDDIPDGFMAKVTKVANYLYNMGEYDYEDIMNESIEYLQSVEMSY